MNYAEWLKTVPEEIRGDPLWKQEAYRLALFAAGLGWSDTTKLFRDGRTVKLAAQLFDAVGSVGANISEGCSRGHGKDRARFYEYALGSALESGTWYFNGRHVLGDTVSRHRLQLHTQIIRLLLSMLPATRGFSLHEDSPPSSLTIEDDLLAVEASDLPSLTDSVPMPEL